MYFNKLKNFENGNKVLDKYFKIIFGMQFQDDNRLNFRLLDGRVMNDLIGQYIYLGRYGTLQHKCLKCDLLTTFVFGFCLNEALVSKC